MSREIRYFDASALMKLVLRDEPGAELATSLWRSSDEVHSSRLTYPEACSAIIKAHRNGRLATGDLDLALDQLDGYWRGVAVAELTEEITRQAREIVLRFALSGADAVHVASAFAAGADADITFVTWDQRQAEAAANLGLPVSPTAD